MFQCLGRAALAGTRLYDAQPAYSCTNMLQLQVAIFIGALWGASALNEALICGFEVLGCYLLVSEVIDKEGWGVGGVGGLGGWG